MIQIGKQRCFEIRASRRQVGMVIEVGHAHGKGDVIDFGAGEDQIGTLAAQQHSAIFPCDLGRKQRDKAVFALHLAPVKARRARAHCKRKEGGCCNPAWQFAVTYH